jgi:hypothetical protein
MRMHYTAYLVHECGEEQEAGQGRRADREAFCGRFRGVTWCYRKCYMAAFVVLPRCSKRCEDDGPV